MLQGLSNVEGGRAALPFVSMFYGHRHSAFGRMILARFTPSTKGRVVSRRCVNALVDGALHKLHRMAFLDDTHVVIPCPDRTTTVYTALQESMFSTTSIHINPGKTDLNAAGVKPSGCGVLQRIAETYDPTAVVWRGSELPTHRQGLNLGTPLGHPDFVRTSLEMKNISHRCFLVRIPSTFARIHARQRPPSRVKGPNAAAKLL